MSDNIQPCQGRTHNGWDYDRECETCRRRKLPRLYLPPLKPMPEPCPNWLPLPGMDYVD